VPRSPADLRKTFLALDHVFFHDACTAGGVRVQWKKFRTAKASFLFGEYDMEKRVVRINARLAELDVPQYVVSAVTMHEMLHFTHGYDHSVAFSRVEHKHPFFYESEQWCHDFCMETLEVSK
jgi:predicted metal-dependent hydrolase